MPNHDNQLVTSPSVRGDEKKLVSVIRANRDHIPEKDLPPPVAEPAKTFYWGPDKPFCHWIVVFP